MEPADPSLVRAALAAVRVWPPDLAPDARYRPLADLDPTAYAAALTRRLGDPPVRVGRSALVIGLAARLWSVTVVPAVTHGVLVDPATLRVREDHGAMVLGVAEPAGSVAATPDDVRRAVLGVLTPLVDALPLSPRLLWGNVASSLYAVPAVTGLPATAPLVRALLARPPLAGELTGELTEPPDGSVRRRTCCLFYFVPGAGLCGDCVLTHAPRRRDVSPGP